MLSLLYTHKHCISPAWEVSISYQDHPLALRARLQITHTFHISIQNLFLIHLSEPTQSVFHCFLSIYVCISILTHMIMDRLCSQVSLKG